MKYIPIAVLCLLCMACKKKSASVTSSAITVDNLAGSFSGSHFHKYKNTTSMGIYSDSTTATDTFTISKTGADSFMLSKPYWDICAPAFSYNSSNVYSRSAGQPAFNDRLREITIRFNTALDSIYVQVHYVTVSSNMLEEWDTFSGKKL